MLLKVIVQPVMSDKKKLAERICVHHVNKGLLHQKCGWMIVYHVVVVLIIGRRQEMELFQKESVTVRTA